MQYIESETLELKSTFGEWKEIIISLCAFANKKGGRVIVGFDDYSEHTGITVGKNTIEDFLHKLRNHTDPVLYPSVNVKVFGLGDMVEIDIPQSDNKPVFAFDKAVVRVGKTNQKLTNNEVRELIKKYTIADFDTQVIDDNISFQISDEYLDAIKEKNISLKPLTKAIYLAFSKKNTMYKNAIIKAARFKGLDMVSFIDMKDFDCELISAVDLLIEFIKRHINKEIIIEGKSQHTERWDYSLPALREALTNAIVHRDYNDPGNIQLRIFDNRIEIISPGFLPKEIEISKLPNTRSIPRNKKLAELFYLMGRFENWGTGFQRMEALSIENGNPRPVYYQHYGAFIISFFKKEGVNEGVGEGVNDGVGEGVGEGVNELLFYIERNPGLQVPNFSDYFKIPNKTIERWIKKLKEAKRIEYKGSAKYGGYYKV